MTSREIAEKLKFEADHRNNVDHQLRCKIRQINDALDDMAFRYASKLCLQAGDISSDLVYANTRVATLRNQWREAVASEKETRL